MSEMENIINEIEAALAEANFTLQKASRQLTEEHRIVLDGREWGYKTMTRVYDALSLLPTLRAALAPVTDEEVNAIQIRHEGTDKYWGKSGSIFDGLQAHEDRATLLRRDAQREAELVRLREALKDMLAHSCVADAGADMKDEEDHAAERRARAALEPKP